MWQGSANSSQQGWDNSWNTSSQQAQGDQTWWDNTAGSIPTNDSLGNTLADGSNSHPAGSSPPADSTTPGGANATVGVDAAVDYSTPQAGLDLRCCYACKRYTYAANGCIMKDCPSKNSWYSGKWKVKGSASSHFKGGKGSKPSYRWKWGKGSNQGKGHNTNDEQEATQFPPSPPPVPPSTDTAPPTNTADTSVAAHVDAAVIDVENILMGTAPSAEVPNDAVDAAVIDVQHILMGPAANLDAVPNAAQQLQPRQGFNCLVCLQECNEGSYFLPCAHGPFHGDCLYTYMCRFSTCPICRILLADPMHSGQLRVVQGLEPVGAQAKAKAQPQAKAKAHAAPATHKLLQ